MKDIKDRIIEKQDELIGKYFEGYDKMEYPETIEFGSFELCGPKVQGNPEKFDSHVLVLHGISELSITDYSYESIKTFLLNPEYDIEGIVFHGKNGKMCKIKKCDFGIKR